MKLNIRKINCLDEVAPAAWNSLDRNGNPFLDYHFLSGLEKHKCLNGHGWYPCHILAESDGSLVGALPLYFKTNSIGEFVFDWSWAEAYERAGGHYYPKLVSAIPFTPATGARYLVKKESPEYMDIKKSLLSAARKLAEETGVSGLHILFPDDIDRKFLAEQGLMIRTSYQYHWFNPGYSNFEDFLAHLNSKKRKQIKKERKTVIDNEISIEILNGKDITAHHWQIYYEFYASTFHRKWGEPRLTANFFQSLSKNIPETPLLVLARYNNRYVAGAFAMLGNDTLYGRHWGCISQFPFLHFELCYYQTIDYCIRNNIKRFDAGAQGEHKISRGFIPVNTWSAHWIANSEFRQAIENFLGEEHLYIEHYMKQLSGHLAYKMA